MTAAADLTWLVDRFAGKVPHVTAAVVVSSDGLVLTCSRRVPPAAADHLAAITAGLISLSRGGAECLGRGPVRQVIVEMADGFFFVTSISDGSAFAVLADESCDLGLVGYEMSLLVERLGQVLTPALRAELHLAAQT